MSHCGFSSLSWYLIFFFCQHCILSDNIYCGLNPDTAKCCCVFDGSCGNIDQEIVVLQFGIHDIHVLRSI